MISVKTVFLIVILALCITSVVKSRFSFPQVKFECLTTRGFRASIPDSPGITRFKLSVGINKDEPDDYSETAKNQIDGFWIIYFNAVTLKEGDTIVYNVNIIANGFVYTTENSWIVTAADLKESYSTLNVASCKPGSSVINGVKMTCSGEVVLTDQFDGDSIDTSLWVVEHRIPTYYGNEHSEFNSYEDIDKTRYIKNGKLHLKPSLRDDDQLKGSLDLRNRCTSNDEQQCVFTYNYGFLVPPVQSARITSRTQLMYGKIEVRAKFPAGDWIVPVIELLANKSTNGDIVSTIFIAQSRGNRYLMGSNDEEIGSAKLYAGPVFLDKAVITFSANSSYYNDFHVFTLEWLPDSMTFHVDSEMHHTINSTVMKIFDLSKMHFLSIGAPVGGLSYFPDGCISGTHSKPWNNTDRNFIKKFYEARNDWFPSWNDINSEFLIDYVKIWTV